MIGEIENWNNGWYGISLGLTAKEIDRLIVLLNELRNDPEQHFHISADCSGEGGIGDIEIYVDEYSAPGNLRVKGLALEPGMDVPVGGA